jgi:hypothetical protein
VRETHYQIMLKELKDRFARTPDHTDPQHQKLAEQVRQRFIFFLDADRTLSLKDVLHKLEQKWLADGLIGQEQKPP